MEIEIKMKLSQEKCPNEIIGVIESNNGQFKKFIEHSKYDKKLIDNRDDFIDIYPQYKKYKKIVLILESPHVDEFNCARKIKSRPAKGKTGKKIRNLLHKKLNSILNKNNKKYNYIVYLVNSIPYQCSLGVKTECYRDYIWLKMWSDKSVRSQLISALIKIEPDIIVNCCTKGKHMKFDVNNGYITFKKGSEEITPKFLEDIGYSISENSNNNNEITVTVDQDIIWKGDKNELNLNSLVKYSVKQNYKCQYYELTHPFNWRDDKKASKKKNYLVYR